MCHQNTKTLKHLFHSFTHSLIHAIDKSGKQPVYLQIAGALSEHIRRGAIPAGSQLPGSRQMAESLQLHRKTVLAAYEELLAQGWLETRKSKGTYVSERLPDILHAPLSLRSDAIQPAEEAGYEFEPHPLAQHLPLRSSNALGFNDGFPDVRIAPWDALSRAYRTALRQGFRKNLLFYGDTAGEPALREAMTDYLRESRGLAIQQEQVMITRGTMMGINLAVQTIVRPGDTVVVGELSYQACNLILRQRDARLQTVPVDDAGLDVEAIEAICRQTPVRMVYVTPHHQHPTTVMMPAERRLKLLQLAKKYRFCILEDDYDFDFHYDSHPILPLASADEGNHVVYVGSLSKVFSPALRVGYVVAPKAVIQSMAALRRIVDRQGDNLLEAAIATMLRDGELQRHLKKAQKVYHRRRDLFCEGLQSALGDLVSFQKPTGGLAVWAKFDPKVPLPALARACKQQGLLLSDGLYYHPTLNATRLGFASVNEAEMQQGLQILKEVAKGLVW